MSLANAKAFLATQREFGSFDRYIRQFVRDTPKRGSVGPTPPVRTPESDVMSKDLRKRGFRFVGTKICYAFMQAVGIVNDHSAECFRRSRIRADA